mgnify:CR=1
SEHTVLGHSRCMIGSQAIQARRISQITFEAGQIEPSDARCPQRGVRISQVLILFESRPQQRQVKAPKSIIAL